MKKATMIGTILILIGTFIPCVLYPFTVPTDSGSEMQLMLSKGGVQHDLRMNELELVLVMGEWQSSSYGSGYQKGRVALSYHYVVVFGIVFLFAGISLLILKWQSTHPY